MKQTNHAQRIEQLEAKVAALEHENSWLRSKLARLGYIEPEAPPLPNTEQTKRLIELVLNAHTALTPQEDTLADFTQQFRRALCFLAFCQRRQVPDTSHDGFFWRQMCGDWLRDNGHSGDRCGLKAFVAACLACNVSFTAFDDVKYVSLGLQSGTRGQPSAGWMDTLARGACLASVANPTTVPRPQPQQQLDMIAANRERW
jgi:hypothetical protein